jgi:hypothetical protein
MIVVRVVGVVRDMGGEPLQPASRQVTERLTESECFKRLDIRTGLQQITAEQGRSEKQADQEKADSEVRALQPCASVRI